MHVFSRVRIFFILLSALYISTAYSFDQNYYPKPPTGYTLSESYPNIRIYKQGASENYVQVIDVYGGAKIGFSNPGIIYSSGKESKITRYSLDAQWNYLSGKVSIVNGQFFDGNTNPTMLSFGVKSGGQFITYGADNGISVKKIIAFYANGIDVIPYSQNSFSTIQASNAIVGLDIASGKNQSSYIGRLAMCSKYGRSFISKPGTIVRQDWLVIFSGKALQQSTVVSELKNFGCNENDIVIMDGSGSSQLKTLGGITMYGGANLIGTPDKRYLPQVVTISNF